MKRLLLIITLSLLACSAAAQESVPAEPFRIEVVEQGSGWPVPLVQLRTTHEVLFVTDNAGMVAIDEPDLLDREVFFFIEGHGYEVGQDGFGYRGVRLTPRAGDKRRIEVTRTMIAQRLGRLTGAGLFAESQRLGDRNDLRESGVVGCDSVQTAVHRGRHFWLWGDTTLPRYPLGVFHASSATTPLQPLASLEPPIHVDFDYFRDDRQRPRGVARMPGSGPTWLSGYVSLPDRDGQPRLVASYTKVKPPLELYEWGLCVWNDETENFDRLKVLWTKTDEMPRPPPLPQGHTAEWRDETGKAWVLFGNPLPTLRCPATFEAWQDPAQWEAITPQESLRAAEDGQIVKPHSGAIAWNRWRRRWVTVFMQTFGEPSAFGELWYAEADSPIGPWGPAVKVLSHNNYTFYNPCLHPEFTAEDSPLLLFEGTYTQQFANKPHPTPRYDYNQILYQLDLRDERLKPAGAGPERPGGEASLERHETFDRDPQWEGRNNRSRSFEIRPVVQDFGFSPTQHAGGDAAGESGGLITPAAEPAYYARELSPQSLNHRLTASGTFLAEGRQFHILLGFFNAQSLNEWRTPNTIALRLYGRGEVFYAYLEYATNQWRAGGDDPQPFAVIDAAGKRQPFEFARGQPHRWSLEYDPQGNNGQGAITATIGDAQSVCHLAPGHQADGATFNRFGVQTVMKQVDSGGEVWLDDLTINGVREAFDQDPGWDSLNNRRQYDTTNVRPRFDFGYCDSQYAGGAKPGEIGGLLFRGDCRDANRMASYADRLEPLTLHRPLRASGKISLRRAVSDSTTLLGFFHSQKSLQVSESQASGFPLNFLGVAIEGPSRDGFFVYPCYRLSNGESGWADGEQRPHIYPNGQPREWSLEYRPGKTGMGGTMSVRLDGQTVRLALPVAHRSAGAEFDRFGFITTWIDGNGQHVYVDDVTYTWRQSALER